MTNPYAGRNVMSDEAQRAIAGYAAWLRARGFPPGAATGEVDSVFSHDGTEIFLQIFEECTILWTPATGAHEIHGGIREKYFAARATDLLGAPITDETDCSLDGRYNHFQRGSIYWHPDAGAHIIHGAVRDAWAARDWERSYLGFPIRDQDLDNGAAACLFQNGGLSSDGDGAAVNDSAGPQLDPNQVMTIVWRAVDRAIHTSPNNLGLHPHRSLDSVTTPYGGPDRATNRRLNVTINGFRDNGLASDTDWSARLTLLLQEERYGNGWDLFVTVLDASTVICDDNTVAYWVRQAMNWQDGKWRIGLPRHPEEPLIQGDDFMALVIMPDGGLRTVFRNTGAGTFSAIILGPNLTRLVQ
jgi:hypothetical protein